MAGNQPRGFFQLIQFSIIGIMNAFIDILSLNLFLFLYPAEQGTVLVLFNTAAYTLAVSNSYYWNSRLTFKGRKGSKRVKVTFMIQAIVSLLISNIVFIGSVHLLGYTAMQPFLVHNLSKGLAMILSSGASFFFMKYAVFRTEKETYGNRKKSSR
ncbi:GtrA family protein [Bacillus sp. P14.5]|uniref:GtrA family protein n=1 Tax=Bacillus sp. P14.5 TaxID=1983400 RepID=UPI000DE88561|nr:GtrA family protein [Bacillus sp. P14.5]